MFDVMFAVLIIGFWLMFTGVVRGDYSKKFNDILFFSGSVITLLTSIGGMIYFW